MSLNESLKGILPKGEEFETLHLRSPSIESHPLLAKQNSVSHEKASVTVKAQHFFTLFHKGKAIYGLEVYVFLTVGPPGSSMYHGERMVFVSKADTTGYADCRVNYRNVTKVLIQYLLSLNPNSYLENVIPRQRDYESIDPSLITKKTSPIKALRILSSRFKSTEIPTKSRATDLYNSYSCSPDLVTTLCLFTRPASQYLFPESSKNSKKHVVDGERLLKWWLSILDDILPQTFQAGTKARLRIPGEDSTRIRRYLRSLKYGDWDVGDVFGKKGNELAVFSIPLFPDDPKARFLRQLVAENRTNRTTVETFWIELQNRQEFKLSVTVSVIGIQGLVETKIVQNPSPSDVTIVTSRKDFNSIKRYVTGEKYDNVSGALEAYTNVRDYLAIRLHQKMPTVFGECPIDLGDRSTSTSSEKTRPIIATTLQPRKKPKKTFI